MSNQCITECKQCHLTSFLVSDCLWTVLTSFSPSWAAVVEDDVKEEAVEESADGQRPVSEHSCHHVRAGTTLKTEL